MPFFDPGFWDQPIDVVTYVILLWFGWIPVAIVLLWGFIQMWKNSRQGMFAASLKWVTLGIDIPATTEQSPKAVENLFTNITGAKSSLTWKEVWIIGKYQPSFSFEIASTDGYIQFYVKTLTKFRDTIEAGIYAQYPDAEISEVPDYVTSVPRSYPNETHEMWGGEMKLKEKDYFPVRTFADFEDKMTQELKDPIGYILEQMAKMRPGENYWIQFVVQVRDQGDWKKAGIDYINKIYGVQKAHKESAVEAGIRSLITIPSELLQEASGVSLADMMLPHAEEKIEDQWKAFKLTPAEIEQAKGILAKASKPGFNVKIRIVYSARKEVFNKLARTALVKGMLGQYANLNLNSFGLHDPSVPKDDYFWMRWQYRGKQTRLMKAFQDRSFGVGATPMILNSEELATLWHFPAISIKAPLIRKSEARRGEPPVGLPTSLEADFFPSGPPKPPVAKAPAPAHVPHGGDEGGHGDDHGGDAHGAHDGHDDHGEHEKQYPHLPIDMEGAGPDLPGVTAPVKTNLLPSIEPAVEHPAVTIVQKTEPDFQPTPHVDVPHVKASGYDESVEEGLDAQDMGEPADILLPGPPPGWVDEGEVPHVRPPVLEDEPVKKDDQPPTNLPV